MDLQARLVRFLRIGHRKRVICVGPGNGGVKQIGAGDGDVAKPQQHMEMQRPPFLKLEPLKVAVDIGGGGMLLVAEDLRSPPIAVTAGQVAMSNLLKKVGNVQGLQGRNFRDVPAIPLPQLFYKWRKGKGPLVWADRKKERRIPVLPHRIY